MVKQHGSVGVITPPTNSEAILAGIRKAKKKKGLVIVNTGNGKGKSTAAFGIMTRAWGHKMRICVIQFIKMEGSQFGEQRAAKRMGIEWISTGGGFTWASSNIDKTAARARRGWAMAQERICDGEYDIVILDEFTYPLCYGWLDTSEVIDWFKGHKPLMLHLIITGRDAPKALVEYADLVTEMREIKHPFKKQGVKAQTGIEY